MSPVKRALVIGNDYYEHNQSLQSCVNDANDLHDALSLIGFRVQRETNLPYNDMDVVTGEFIESIRPGDITLFYFSGHACQMNGINYLIPSDADKIHENMLYDQAIDIQTLIDSMHRKRPRLVMIILDCCRTHPNPQSNNLRHFFRLDSRKIKDGLAPMKAPKSTIIAYACAPNRTAAAGRARQRNSAYTCYLLNHILSPIEIKKVFQKTAIGVQNATNSKQTPFLYNNCSEPIYLMNSTMLNNPALQNFLFRRHRCGVYMVPEEDKSNPIQYNPSQYSKQQYPWDYSVFTKMKIPKPKVRMIIPFFPLAIPSNGPHGFNNKQYPFRYS